MLRARRRDGDLERERDRERLREERSSRFLSSRRGDRWRSRPLPSENPRPGRSRPPLKPRSLPPPPPKPRLLSPKPRRLLSFPPPKPRFPSGCWLISLNRLPARCPPPPAPSRDVCGLAACAALFPPPLAPGSVVIRVAFHLNGMAAL